MSAFDFSPINIASHLIRGTGRISDYQVSQIRTAINEWREAYGPPSGSGYVSAEMFSTFSPREVDAFCWLLERNIRVALELARTVEMQGLGGTIEVSNDT